MAELKQIYLEFEKRTTSREQKVALKPSFSLYKEYLKNKTIVDTYVPPLPKCSYFCRQQHPSQNTSGVNDNIYSVTLVTCPSDHISSRRRFKDAHVTSKKKM